MSKDNRQVVNTNSQVTTKVVGAIIIVLILMLGFLIYTGKINLPMFGSSATRSGTGTNGNGYGTNGDGTNTGTDTSNSTNGSNGSSGSDGSSGGTNTTNGSGGIDVQISVDPNKPGASVKTNNPGTNANVDGQNPGVNTGL